MARTQFSAQVYDQKNTRELRHVKSRIVRAYDALCKEAGVVGTATGWSDPNKQFKLSDYPNAQKKIEKLLEGLAGEIQSIITDGIDNAWELSHQKNSAMVQSLANTYGWSEARANALSRRNLASLAAFKARTQAGMHLSDRVWDFVKHDRQKIEWALELGLAEGKSAAALSRDVRQYLDEPNKLFRRVKNKHGQLVLSQAAKAYHPGQGVYRSSYKNALRLAATETNMAYRTADHEAWQKMPFVIGQEVKLSDVHATSDTQGKKYPVRYADMCDELAGVYPKDFKFTGWHPHCRCYVVAKLASREELEKYSRLSDKEQERYHFQDEVTEMPKVYNDWMDANAQRIKDAMERGSALPYFMRDNYVDWDPTKELLYKDRARQRVNIEELRDKWLQIAAERHAARTPEQIAEIQERWNEHLDRVRSSETFEQIKARMGDNIPATLEQYEEVLKKYKYLDKDLVKNQKEINALMKKLMDENDYGMDIKHGLLESVYDKGFLNTFQTGSSGGYHGSSKTTGKIEEGHGRLTMSHKMYDAKNASQNTGGQYTGPLLERAEYEKYGHLIDRDKTESYSHNLTWYGDVQVRFKKRDVTPTWTYDDSLRTHGEYYQPTLASDPKVHSFDNDGVKIKKTDSWDSLNKWQREHGTSYIELQYHGNVTIDMVQSMTFGRNPGDLISADLIDRLMQKDIEIWYLKKSAGKVVQMKDMRMKQNPELELSKEALGRFRERGVTIWYKDDAGQIVSYDYTRLDKKTIEQIAAERHAARTPEREKELRDYAKSIQTRTEATRKRVEDAIKQAEGFIDTTDGATLLRDLTTGKVGGKVMSTGKTATACLEKLQTEAKKIEEQIATIVKESKKMVDLIPDIDALHGTYNMEEIKRSYKIIKTNNKALAKMTLEDQEKALEQYLLTSDSAIAKKVFTEKLQVVKVDIKIKELTPDITDIVTAANNASVGAFKNISSKAQAALTSRDVAQAEALLKEAKAMQPLVDKYAALEAYQTGSPKFKNALADIIKAFDAGDLTAAEKNIVAADKIMKDLERSKAYTAAKRAAEKAAKEAAAKAAAEEAARKKAEEEAAALAASLKKEKKMTIDQAKSIDDLEKILGDDLPVLLKNYRESVKRLKFTDDKYKKDAKAIEKKMKEFFDSHDFAHQCRSELLADMIEYRGNKESGGYLVSGVLNNLQANEAQAKVRRSPGYSIKGEGYDESRMSYGHYAYNVHGKGEKYEGGWNRVEAKERLDINAYYRCGTPVPKDLEGAWEASKAASGYGDAQIVFRKDRVITTWTYDNSLGQNTIPSLTCDPKVCSIDGKSFKNYKSAKYTDDNILASERGWNADYIEIQYLPKASSGRILPRDMERIILPKNPLDIHPQRVWDIWKKEGVDIYYYDRSKRKVVLFAKGDPLEDPVQRKIRLEAQHTARRAARDAALKKQGLTPQERIAQLIAQRAEDKINAQEFAKEFYKKAGELVNADLTKSEFTKINTMLKKGNVFGARKQANKIIETIEKQKAELATMHDLIPDAEKWHKQFSIEELKTAHNAIQKQLNWLENKYEGRHDADRMITKIGKIIQDVEHPEIMRPGAVRYNTWEVAQAAYIRKRDEIVYQYRKDSIDASIKELKAYKTKDKDFKAALKEIQEKAADGKWFSVEDLITKAKKQMLALQENTGAKHVLKLGECGTIVFSKEDFDQARKDAAKWFKAKGKTKAAMKKAFKEADDYMSQYAEEMWKNLTQEEKMILWLYTDGSKYISEEMLGIYQLRVKSWIDKSLRNGLADANVITSIIEKAPALKDDIWMQSAQAESTFKAIFGADIRRANINDLIGIEGSSDLFMSCHSARDGFFTHGGSTGGDTGVVLSIYMPKGTKGVYLEPIASYGDSKRGAAGFEWDGTKRKEAPSDQVEFLLQRGAKFKITKVVYDKDQGKWFVDVDLIEQRSMGALNTKIDDLEYRRIRYKAPTT